MAETTTDGELLARAREQSSALGVFYDRYEAAVMAYFVRRTRDPHTALELTAETFAEVVLQCHRGTAVREPVAWLFAIAHAKLADFYRRGAVEERARTRLGIGRLETDEDAYERIEADGTQAGEPRTCLSAPLDEGDLMSLSPQLRSELVAAMERGPRARRPSALALAAVAAVLVVGLVLARLDNADRAAQPKAPVWAPVLGDSQRGHATTTTDSIPAEQLAALGVLRRPQTDADRSPEVEALLKVLGRGNRGVHVDGIRLLARHGTVHTVLVPMQELQTVRGTNRPMRDVVCLLRGPLASTVTRDGSLSGGAGMHCATTDDLLTRQVGWPRPPFGLVPDGIARVTVRIRGGTTLSAPVRGNVYDLTQHRAAVAIQPPHWFDQQGKPVRRPWRAGTP